MIRKKTHDRERIIDLTGPDGNAYFLMGYATNLAKQLGIDPKTIIEDMKSGDYENLVSVFDKHFGSFVTLER
jgi:hypothetical protein